MLLVIWKLVYSTAVRRVGGDKHVAEDIVQTVFADLARKARRLSGGIVLAGWLYRHTCFVAASMVRADHRRQTRERHALEMNEQNQDPAPAWEQLAPFLDEGLASLKAGDRDAIVLRYLERRDLRTVALRSASTTTQLRSVWLGLWTSCGYFLSAEVYRYLRRH